MLNCVPQIRKTMRAIKHVLTERWYAYEEARKIAEKDPGLKDYFEVHSPG